MTEVINHDSFLRPEVDACLVTVCGHVNRFKSITGSRLFRPETPIMSSWTGHTCVLNVRKYTDF